MYKLDMPSNFQNIINIQALSEQPDLIIWYAKISKITQEILCENCFQDPGQIKNKIFDKNSFKQYFLNDNEISTINGFKAMKKQIEWMSGRYLVKGMIQHNFYPDLPLDQINLSYLDQGAPFLTYAPKIPLSLSHSNNYTTVACSENNKKIIGIDIEKIAKKPDKWFLKTAFTNREISHLQDNAVSIFSNWTIKEAYLKYIKKGFNESLHKVEVIDKKIWHNGSRINVDVYSTIINDDGNGSSSSSSSSSSNNNNNNDDYVLSLVTN